MLMLFSCSSMAQLLVCDSLVDGVGLDEEVVDAEDPDPSDVDILWDRVGDPT